MKVLLKFSKKFIYLSQSAAVLIAIVAATIQVQPLFAAGTTLAPGDIVFTGYITNGTIDAPDAFSFITLVPLSAGTEIYFTDNGWTGSNFRGVTELKADGSEGLARLTVNNPIVAGAVIRSNDTSLDFTWIVTGSIASGVIGNYTPISLGQAGDQLTALQSVNSTNPIFSGFTPLAQIDYSGVFEPAINSATGDLVPMLSQAAGTVVLFNNLAPYAAFNLNSLASGTISEWRTAIGNSANWTFNTTGTSLPTGAVTVLTPASILTQPVSNQTINISTTATLNVTAGGTAPFSYQWYQGSTGDISNPVTNGTSASFTTPVLTETTSYWVRVSNNLGAVDSMTATVNVVDLSTLTEIFYLPVVLR